MRRADPKLPSPKGPGEAGRRPIAWRIPKRPALGALAILVSVLAHLFLTGIVFLELDPRAPRHGALEAEEQGFDIVFDGSAAPGAPVEVPPTPPPPAQASVAPPSPMAGPPAPAPPPIPAPPPPQPATPQAIPSPPPPPPSPLADLPAPPPPPPPPPQAQMAEAPRPVPPAPQPVPDAPQPVAPQRTEAPRPNAEPRPPLDFSHLPPIRLGEQGYRPRNRLDFTLGPVPNAALSVPNMQLRGAENTDNWRREFYRWLDQNVRYPRDAADFGEQGIVGVRIFAAPDGAVRRVELRTASRSITLNHYSQSVFRGAKLPAFTRPESNEVEIDLRIHYNLIRR